MNKKPNILLYHMCLFTKTSGTAGGDKSRKMNDIIEIETDNQEQVGSV
jgi:hypothetical protein